MTRVPLDSLPYSGKSVIASGQECVNLYCEVNLDPEAPSKTTYYPTAGTLLYANPLFRKPSRGAYRTSIGTAYYVVGSNLYFVNNAGILSQIATIADRPSQIRFSDNGIVCVLVDGQNGYVVDLITNAFGKIVDPNFYAADFVTLLDTFFIFNRALTNQFFISASNASFGMLTNSGVIAFGSPHTGGGYVNGTYNNVPLTGGSGTGATANLTVTGTGVTTIILNAPGQGYIVGDILSANNANLGGSGAGFQITVTGLNSAFDPLDIAAKSGFSDPIVGIVAVHRELWLIGALTTEIWIGTGAADFFFQEVQGAYINHGCAAQQSIATQDVLTFFIMQDQQGKGIVVQGQGYDVTEISTPKIVSEFKNYVTLNDAIGFCFQIEDHSFYALVFPTANKGWLYDLTTSNLMQKPMWYEWNWIDDNGNFNRPRANCAMFVNGVNIVGDFQNGCLLQLDINTYIDTILDNNGNARVSPIVRIRTFPHMVKDNFKNKYLSFDADIEPGTGPTQDIVSLGDTKWGQFNWGSGFWQGQLDQGPTIYLSWSNDKGKTYGNPMGQSMGKGGEYLTVPTWNRLGQARDRVFKLSWDDPVRTALNGGFCEVIPARA